MTLSGLLIKAVRRHGDRIAVRYEGGTLSYGQLERASNRLAGFLFDSGIRRGQCIALHLRSGPEYVIADLAILKLGAVKVPLNELSAANELSFYLAHSGARALISHTSLQEPRPDPGTAAFHGLVINVCDGAPARSGAVEWTAALARGAEDFQAVDVDAEDPALIIYTGGTTGVPKGVRHVQGRLATCLLAQVICGEVRPEEVMLLTTPLPHSAGFHLQACLFQGGEVVLSRSFEPASFLSLVEQHRVTWTFAVPTMLYRLLDAIDASGAPPASLRTILYGAAPMNSAKLREAIRYFGPVFIQLYGQTECPNYIATLSKADHLDETLLGSCGKAVPFVDVLVRGEIAGCRTNEVGEVQVRGPYLLAEYYRNEQATEEAIVRGWLRTGDLGYMNEAGYLFLVDRVKDMIISGGMNVYSVEVENVIRQHPAVRAVAVVGAPDADWGEIVVAVVVPSQGADAEDIRKFARSRLSGYKAPKRVMFAEELPVTRFGKVDKKALRALVGG